jgi:SAM-dependent methyltransferase
MIVAKTGKSSIREWWINSWPRAYISKTIIAVRMPKFYVNFGVDTKTGKSYSERLVELPFLFRNIREPPAKVLDIGCTCSIVSIQLAMLGYSVTGIDIQNYYFRHKNFEFVKGDFNTYDFKGKKFDIIVDISAIEHFGLHTFSNMKLDLDADRKAMRKIRAMLKPGGQLIITAPFGVHELIGNFQRIYGKKDMKDMLKGFRVENSRYYRIRNGSALLPIDAKTAERVKYDAKNGEYAVVMISATKA